jgi:hypothetical protein
VYYFFHHIFEKYPLVTKSPFPMNGVILKNLILKINQLLFLKPLKIDIKPSSLDMSFNWKTKKGLETIDMQPPMQIRSLYPALHFHKTMPCSLFPVL